jgi:hypothetical protein
MNEKELTKKRKKLSDILKENLQKIIIVLVSLLYISQGLFKLQRKEATLWDILGNIGLSIIIGIMISSNMRSMGLRDGRRSEIYMNSMKTYGQAKEEATPNFDSLPAWCEYKNNWELEIKKKEIIQGNGLNWKAYKLGYYEDHKEKLTEKQLKALEDVKACKIARISSSELLSDLPKSKLKSTNRFGESERDYASRNNVIDFLTRSFIGICSGFYGLWPLMTGENATEIISGVIWNATQIIIWIAFGLMKYVDAKSFIEDEYRQTHIIQKTELLNEFIVTMKNSPNVIHEYDENLELDEYIDKYIQEREKMQKKEEISYE